MIILKLLGILLLIVVKQDLNHLLRNALSLMKIYY